MAGSGLQFRLSPASVLFATKEANRKPIYGRHPALKPMRKHLICFRITSPGNPDSVPEHLHG
jgi:hypothetical protein